MNRPYGAVDVAANLKGAIPKATVQKILIALTEKNLLVQKTYGMQETGYMHLLLICSVGKTTFFVFNQSNIDTVPASEVTAIEAEQKTIDEENQAIASEIKTAQSGIYLGVHAYNRCHLLCCRTFEIENNAQWSRTGRSNLRSW